MSARTIVIRETSTRGKYRWHALWVFGDEDTPAYELVREFRTRQHHEQTYRIMLHDIHVDTAPSGYNKRSSQPHRPGFQQNSLTLYAWIAALATNALQAFSLLLPASSIAPIHALSAVGSSSPQPSSFSVTTPSSSFSNPSASFPSGTSSSSAPTSATPASPGSTTAASSFPSSLLLPLGVRKFQLIQPVSLWAFGARDFSSIELRTERVATRCQ